ncbi:hypothetical protein BKA70DRAFT_335900 [Coprinopsis sp. MPI-PUGE-AT-0042]|nr:hypothetical protein BKA70DRAFT_335900 [Coprinopsis sp. MPI-PUGE-AT-0042]
MTGLNYLVNIGEDGKLYWAKNGLPVDTAAGRWKDAGDGAGVVPMSLPSGIEKLNAPERMVLAQEHHTESETSSKAAGNHYVGEVGGKHPWSRFFKNHFTVPAIVNKVLRKTTEKNTWMYISVSRRRATPAMI